MSEIETTVEDQGAESQPTQDTTSILTGTTETAGEDQRSLTSGEVSDAAGEVNVDDFVSTLPEELRAQAAKKGFKGAADAIKAHAELESLMGKRFEDLTADEVKSLNVKMGAPEDPTGYELSVPEELSEYLSPELQDGFAKLAHEQGISKTQAESLYNWYMENQTKELSLLQSSRQQQAEEQVNVLKQEFGVAFDEKVSLANQALRQFGGDDAVTALAESGMSSNPALVKMLSEVGKLIGEDQPVGQSNRSFTETPAEAKAQIAELYRDKAFMKAFSNPMESGYKAAQEKMEILYKKSKG